MVRKQRTLLAECEYSGMGLHTGAMVTLRFKPAPESSGIRFVRVDMANQPVIPAHISSVVQRDRQTSLASGGAEVQTVEHVLAALRSLSIDNATVEINSIEPPGADGSAKEFIHVLKSVGIKEQEAQAKVYKITEPVTYSNGNISLAALPSTRPGMTLSYTLDFDHAMVPRQHKTFVFKEEDFIREIAAARTFVFEHEAKALQAMGHGKGANTSNTCVIGEHGLIDNELRYDDEFVRHKILDLFGDLSLLGADLDGHIVGIKSGHTANTSLARKIFEKHEGQFKARGQERPVMDVRRVLAVLPHRYPMLLVDKVVEYESGTRLRAIKNITVNEEFFRGHFPARPVMPGVLQIEALAQAGGLLMMSEDFEEDPNRLTFLVGIDKCRFRRPAEPGDQLTLDVTLLKRRMRMAVVSCQASVQGEITAECELMFTLVQS